ncbi:MAG: hypothetical protein KAT65_10700, partial [Methanophagales archaeon]|nr:hypothetical protein [Methanophagales archaeon]
MKKADASQKLVSLFLIAIMLCSLFAGAVIADVNEGATAANADLALSNSASSTANTGYESWYYYVGAIVNTANGNLFFPVKDISIRARGFDIGIVRSYNSLSGGKDSPFGYGWTFNYNTYLVENGNVTLFDGDGSAHTFTHIGDGDYTSPPGTHSKLRKNPDGTFILRFKDGSKYNFDENGRLLNITDKNGNQLTFRYTDGKLTLVEDDSGLNLAFSYDGNKINNIVDPLSRQITY